MFDRDLQLRVGGVATDFFLNLIAVTALVALPVMIPFGGQPALAPAPVASRPLAEVRGEREAAERNLARLQSEHAAASDAVATDDRMLAASADGLRADLARLTVTNVALADQVARAQTTPRAASFGVPLAHDTDKKAVFFILANGRLLPVNKDAGHFNAVNVNGGLVIFNPTVPGEPVASVAEGKSPAANLTARAIAAIDPGKEFLFVFLGDDSFDAFYQLRGVLRQRGIAMGWAPLTGANRQVIFASGNNGSRPNVDD